MTPGRTFITQEEEDRNGYALPRILQLQREKLKKEDEAARAGQSDGGGGKQQQPGGDGANKRSVPSPISQAPNTMIERRKSIDATFESGLKLDHAKYLKRCGAAVSQLQGLIYRMEESYHDETYAHGNMYRGLEILLDMKLSAAAMGVNGLGGAGGGAGLGAGNGGGAPGSGGSGVATGTKRRMTQEDRWFSSSCGSVPPPNARTNVRGRGRQSVSSYNNVASPSKAHLDANACAVPGTQVVPSAENLFAKREVAANYVASQTNALGQTQSLSKTYTSGRPVKVGPEQERKKPQYTNMIV
jgi:hypothetical protein